MVPMYSATAKVHMQVNKLQYCQLPHSIQPHKDTVEVYVGNQIVEKYKNNLRY